MAACPTLMRELGFLLGIPIHYYAAIDLAGFVRMVDAVGGVTVVNPRAINDPGLRRLDRWPPDRLPADRRAAPPQRPGRRSPTSDRARAPATTTSPGPGASSRSSSRSASWRPTRRCCRSCRSDLERRPNTLRSNFPRDRLGDARDRPGDRSDAGVRQVVLGPRRYATNPPPQDGWQYHLVLEHGRASRAISVELFGAGQPLRDGSGSGSVAFAVRSRATGPRGAVR